MATKSSRGASSSSAEADNSDATQGGNSEEARHLAEEALEERRQGNEEEAKFVLEEARELDPNAVDEVLKKGAKHQA